MAGKVLRRDRRRPSKSGALPALIVCGFVIAIGAMVASSIGVADSKTSRSDRAIADETVTASDAGRGNKGKGKALGLQRDRDTKRGVLVVKNNGRGSFTNSSSSTSSSTPSSSTTTSEPGSSSTSTMSVGSSTTTKSGSSSTTAPVVSSTSTPSTKPPTTSVTTTAVTSTTVTSTTIAPTTTAKPATTSTTAAPRAGEWFEGFDSLNTSRWAPEHSTYGDGNGERQCYQPDNVSVQGGKLVLRAVEQTVTCPGGSTRTISSGMVRSRGLSFSPGQAIEFRVKLTVADPSNQAGLWPAVWASSWAGGGWPTGGELDFLEVMTAEDPNRAVFSMHYADESGRHRLQNRPSYLGGRFSDEWHTIRFDYGYGGKLTWYLDGRETFSVDYAATRQGYPAPFDQTIREIKVNMAVGGSPGALGSGVLSKDATFEVDYIRVFNL